MMKRAFRDYPKLSRAFPAFADRQAGIEATIRYFGAFDLFYGAGFSLDANLHECVMLVHSDELDFSEERIRAAGCESPAFQATMQKLAGPQRRVWFELFDELDRLELTLDLPEKYLYLDFVAVDPRYQGRGRGQQLMQTLGAYADSAGMPMMLFTNTSDDVRFYEKCGFYVAGVTESEKFGFRNTYLVRDCAKREANI